MDAQGSNPAGQPKAADDAAAHETSTESEQADSGKAEPSAGEHAQAAAAGPSSQPPMTTGIGLPVHSQGSIILPGVQLLAVSSGMPQRGQAGFVSAAAAFQPIPQPLPMAGPAAQRQPSTGQSATNGISAQQPAATAADAQTPALGPVSAAGGAGGSGGNPGMMLPDQAGGSVSLKDIMADSKLNWEGFEKFGTVQEILEHNKLLIAEINANHELRTPPALARNVPLIRELNGNVTRVVQLYNDLAAGYEGMIADNMLLEQDRGAEAPLPTEEAAGTGAVQAQESGPPMQANAPVPLQTSDPPATLSE